MALRRSHFQCGNMQGEGHLRVPQPEGPPPAPPPSWARKEFCVVVCAALLTFVCMMRYSEWNVVPIWFLYSSVLMAIRYADLQSGSGILRYLWWYAVPICDLVLGFFGTYGGSLCRSAIWFWDSSVLMVVCCADLRSGSGILRYLWWFAVPICDLVLGFFGTYGGMLCRSGSGFFDIYDGTLCRSGSCILDSLMFL